MARREEMELLLFCFSIFENEGLMVVRFFGNSTTGQQIEQRRETRADPRFRKVHRIIVDLTELQATSTTGGDMASSALTLENEFKDRPQKMRYALFSPPGSYGYGIGRMFQNASGGAQNIEVSMFESAQEACQWLQLSQPAEHYVDASDFAEMR